MNKQKRIFEADPSFSHSKGFTDGTYLPQAPGLLDGKQGQKLPRSKESSRPKKQHVPSEPLSRVRSRGTIKNNIVLMSHFAKKQMRSL